ncbi:hypothetical protein [Tropicimonas sp. S265A]|uniref:hypothetical protein n=1 Tax=Tropicimonas sp. S265A TaxID=3415134 RepID=UPI003C7E017E
MPEKFLTLPAADCDADGLPTTLANATLQEANLSGLSNGTAYRALVLQDPSPAFTPAAADVAPVISGVPTISGTEQQGATLTVTPAAATGFPVPVRALQWLRDGAVIPGATGLTYVLQAADVGSGLSVRQTETNSQGSDTATSETTDSIMAAAPMLPPTSPTISGLSFDDVAGDLQVDIDMKVAGDGLLVWALWDDTKSGGTPPVTDNQGAVTGNVEQAGTQVADSGPFSYTLTYPATTTANRLRVWAINVNGEISDTPIDVAFTPSVASVPTTLAVAGVHWFNQANLTTGQAQTNTGAVPNAAGSWLLALNANNTTFGGGTIDITVSGANSTVTRLVSTSSADNVAYSAIYLVEAAAADTLTLTQSGTGTVDLVSAMILSSTETLSAAAVTATDAVNFAAGTGTHVLSGTLSDVPENHSVVALFGAKGNQSGQASWTGGFSTASSDQDRAAFDLKLENGVAPGDFEVIVDTNGTTNNNRAIAMAAVAVTGVA